MADVLKSAGVEMPELAQASLDKLRTLLPPMTFLQNTVDTGRPGATFSEVVATIAQDAQIDAVLVFALNEPSVLNPSRDLDAGLATGKPVAFGTLGTTADIAPVLARDCGSDISCRPPGRRLCAGRPDAGG